VEDVLYALRTSSEQHPIHSKRPSKEGPEIVWILPSSDILFPKIATLEIHEQGKDTLMGTKKYLGERNVKGSKAPISATWRQKVVKAN
jgi:hypothetical protein